MTHRGAGPADSSPPSWLFTSSRQHKHPQQQQCNGTFHIHVHVHQRTQHAVQILGHFHHIRRATCEHRLLLLGRLRRGDAAFSLALI